MILLQRTKRRIGGPLLELMTKRFGLEVSKLQGLDRQILKLKSITDPKARLRAAKELVRLYPRHPKPHLEFAVCLNELLDPRQFEQMDRYGEVRREWLIHTGLEELNMEFIWPGNVMGSLGNHYDIEVLLKANRTELRTAKKPFLLLPENSQLRNPALFEYVEPHLHVIRDVEAIQAMRRLESILTLPLGWFLPMNEGVCLMDFVANRTEMERKVQGRCGAFIFIK